MLGVALSLVRRYPHNRASVNWSVGICVCGNNNNPVQAEPLGSIQLAGREIAVRGRRTRGERLWDVVKRAYAEKYDTKASKKWVRGFAEQSRAATTLELVPATAAGE